MHRTLGWVLILVAVLGWTAWSQVRGLWEQRNELIGERIHKRLAEIAPEWDVRFDAAELQAGARVRLTNLRVGLRNRDDVLVEIPELVAQLDPELLSQSLQVMITRIDAHQAIVHIERDAAGRWNWEELPRLVGESLPSPEVTCRNCTVEVHLQPSDLLPEMSFELSRVNVEAINRSFRSYKLQGRSQVDSAGAITFDGTLDLDTLAWTLSGRCAELRSPDRLLQLAASLSPEARRKVDNLASQAVLPVFEPGGGQEMGDGASVRTVTQSSTDDSRLQRCCIPALGVAARFELAFNLISGAERQPLQYQLGARVRDGVIDNPALPVPLYDLHGELFLDNSQVIVRSFQAANGQSRLFVDGHLRRDDAVPQRRFAIQAHNLQFGGEIRNQLSGRWLQFYDAMRPAGRFNVDVAAETDVTGQWDVTLNRFEAQDCSVLLRAFPYPTQQVSGRIWQEGERFLVDFAGLAGARPFTARGEFRDPGQNVRADIEIDVQGAPIDDTLRNALSTPPLLPAQRALDRLRPTGFADVRARVVKRGTPLEPVKVAIDARLREATVNHAAFPLLVTGIQGRIANDPLAADPALRDIWTLTDLTGRHGQARISAAGGFAVNGTQALLDLTLTSVDTPIDRDLEQACLTASPAFQELFDSLHPVGTVDLENVRVVWTPGTTPVVSLPSILLKEGEVRLKYWPFPWERVTGKLAWDRNRLTISSLAGWYRGETYLQIDNHGVPEAAMLDIPPSGDLAWRLHLEQVRIRQLIPDSVFRRSLIPSGLAAIAETLDPRGPLDLDIGLDLKRTAGSDGVVTAEWHVDAALKGNSFTPGIELSDVTGHIHVARGVWDGVRSFVDGYFELDSATALDLPLEAINGPFLVDGENVTIGTPAWSGVRAAPPHDPVANPYATRELQADLYDGKVGVSLQARLSAQDPELSTYRAVVTVRDAQLEAWAADNGSSADRLRGPVNGRIDFVGQGTSDRSLRGQGWVQISPAQLYELPVLNRVMASFNLQQPNRTAFTYAYGEFTLQDGFFNFSLIDLVGEALRLVGYGKVAYAEGLNEQLAIEFYRSKFRNQIPIWGQIFSAVTTNSIGVRVSGTVSEPIVNVQPKLGIVDDSLRKLLDAFNAGQTPTAPRSRPLLGQPVRRNQAVPQ